MKLVPAFVVFDQETLEVRRVIVAARDRIKYQRLDKNEAMLELPPRPDNAALNLEAVRAYVNAKAKERAHCVST